MKKYLAVFLLLASSYAIAQCVSQNGATQCTGPLVVLSPTGNTVQSSITLVDLGLPSPAPTVNSYILSVQSGVLQESDNAGIYHTLIGPSGPTGAQGAQGIQGVAGPPGVIVGTVLTGTLSCPKSKGTVSSGFTTKACTFTVTGALQPSKSKARQ